MSFLTHLECSRCQRSYPADRPQTLCADCARPLLARYDLDAIRARVSPSDFGRRENSLWRYRELLPLPQPEVPVTLGEGWTPLLPLPRYGAKYSGRRVFLKDESGNPTGSFKARGMSLAVSMAAHFGIRAVAAPSAGNAAGALAAYAARAGMTAHLFMPRDTPRANVLESEAVGAHVTLFPGLITDCGAEVSRRKTREGWFDVSTLREPYRLEGKKTLGYELAEQGGWTLPDVIIYPTGGGTGLIGLHKSFAELRRLGWIADREPRLVAVQAEGCQPVVRAFRAGWSEAPLWAGAMTDAAGIRVPQAIGDRLMLQALRQTRGLALAVSDAAMAGGVRELGATEGIFACPEGGACAAAFQALVGNGWIAEDEVTVLFNTASGTKYAEFFARHPVRRGGGAGGGA